MRNRWRIVLVDEFQDTDPVQWQILERAFHGPSTLILIGDPKQAIYGFRGGDVDTYLRASRQAGTRATLGTNRRSDAAARRQVQRDARQCRARLGPESSSAPSPLRTRDPGCWAPRTRRRSGSAS